MKYQYGIQVDTMHTKSMLFFFSFCIYLCSSLLEPLVKGKYTWLVGTIGLSFKLAVAFRCHGLPTYFAAVYTFLFVGSACVGELPDSAAFFRLCHKVVLDSRMGSAARDEGKEADVNWDDDG